MVLGNIKSAVREQEARPRRPADFEHPSTAAMIFPPWCPASAGSLSERRRRILLPYCMTTMQCRRAKLIGRGLSSPCGPQNKHPHFGHVS